MSGDRGELRHVVPTPVEAKPLFVWEATVRFSTTYDLPNNVLEAAVLRAIAGADIAKVESLKTSQFGSNPPADSGAPDTSTESP